MSVYIPGMDMPKNCCDCPVCDTEYAKCQITKRNIFDYSDGTPPSDCPLVPVPPHGALMDRDDFFAVCPELVDGYKRITDDLVIIPAEEGER